ncbi:hypothetical protein BSNK01_29700 [Bacillaceae bacterium]
MGELLAVLALCMFSANIIITKVASNRLNLNLGFLISVTVNVVFSALLFIVQFFFRQEPFQWNTYAFFLFLLTGLFSTYLGRWLFFEAISKLGPAKASTVQVSNPLFTVIIAWLFLGERLTPFDVSAVLLILLGLFLVSYMPQGMSQPDETAAAQEECAAGFHEQGMAEGAVRGIKLRKVAQSGILLAFFSSLSYAISNILRGSAIKVWNEPVLGGLLGAVSGLLIHMIFSSHKSRFVQELKKADRTGVRLYTMGGILTISAQICLIASMWYIPVSIANLITLSTPVLVTPLSYFLLKNEEGINFRTILGIVMVLSGISIIILT